MAYVALFGRKMYESAYLKWSEKEKSTLTYSNQKQRPDMAIDGLLDCINRRDAAYQYADATIVLP